MFSNKALNFFLNLKEPTGLSPDVTILNPYKLIPHLAEDFFNKFYNDDNTRVFILGINPGRYGGGLTGISFTDPVALRKFCGIENNLGDKRELSSEFIYMVVEELGGAEKFFRRFFLTAQFPLALLRNGKNYNFYDDKKTFNLLLPYLKESVSQQAKFGTERKRVISLGLKNAGILSIINSELKLFDKIEVLEHPRFIMQYRRKYLKDYIMKYSETLMR